MKINEEPEHWANFLQSNWALISVFCLGLALTFNVGYFAYPIGFDPFLTSTEDLAKSFLYVVFLYLVVQNVIFLFDDLSNQSTRRGRLTVTVIGLIAIASPPAIGLAFAYKDGDYLRIVSNFWDFGTRIIALFLFSSMYFLEAKSLTKLNIRVMMILSLSSLGIAYCFGNSMFFTDLHLAKLVVLKIDDSTELKTYLVARRSTRLLTFDKVNCEFVLIDNSKIISISFNSTKLKISESELKTCFKN